MDSNISAMKQELNFEYNLHIILFQSIDTVMIMNLCIYKYILNKYK